MRSGGVNCALFVVILSLILHTSDAFHTTLTKSSPYPKTIGNNIPLVLVPTTSSSTRITRQHNDFTILHANNNESSNNSNNNNAPLQKFDRVFNTMKTAGFENYSMQMSPKRFLLIFVGMVVFKYIRSRKLKQSFMEKQPAWGHVITSKDEEKNLHAWTCKNCGSTMFIAKGREIRFFNPLVGIECQTCGAKGKDSFYDRREEIAAEDDTDFQYENPMDYISKEERKKLMKQMEAEKKNGDSSTSTTEVVSVSSSSDSEGQIEDSGGSSSSSSNSGKSSKGSDDSDPLGMDL